MKHNSSRVDLGVFDFNEEIDSIPTKWTPKCVGKPKFNDSPSDDYNFLRQAARGSILRSEISVSSQYVDVDAIDDDDDFRANDVKESPLPIPLEDNGSNLIKCTPGIALEHSASEPLDELIHVSGPAVEHPSYLNGHILHSESFSANLGMIMERPADVSPNRSVGTTSSDVVDDSDDSCPSTPTSVLMENNVATDQQANIHSCNDIEMENDDTSVILCADYVSYHNKYCPTSLIYFSSNSFKIEVLSAHKVDETTPSEWDIDDIVNIWAQWSCRTATARVRLRVRSKETCLVGRTPGISGIEELEAVIHDRYWHQKQEKIMLLSLKYKDLWITELNVDREGDIFPVDSVFHGGTYFPDFDEAFQEVIYPEGDTDAVSISKRDVDLLQPETFVNDTIIDFYIKYLKNKIPSNEMHRFHFFNSFFFRKLADLDKNPSSAFEGKAAFQRVRKWTRKCDLFGKDYIFIPVNYNLHWSLIVICHPGEVADFEDGDMCKSSRVPCILHMDSIRGSHMGLKNLIQSYLWEEWKERRKETSEEVASKFLNLRFLSLELPQQENCYDCGLFLLHYVELFVAEAPVDFNPFNITKFSNFLTAEWFLPAEVSLKRAYIQRLIYDLINRERASVPTSCSIERLSSELPEISGNDTNIELVSERRIQRMACGNSLYDLAKQETGMDLLSQSCFRNHDSVYEAMGGFFRPDPYDLGQSSSNLANAISHIEPEVETHEGHPYVRVVPEFVGILTDAEPSNTPYPSGGIGSGISCDPGISDHDEDASTPASDYDSEDSELVLVEETFVAGPVSVIDGDETEGPTCLSGEGADYVIKTFAFPCNKGEEETSGKESESDKGQNCKNEWDPLPSHKDDMFYSNCEPGLGENKGVAGADEQMMVNDSSSDSDVLHVAKRIRLSPSFNPEGEVARCKSRELQL